MSELTPLEVADSIAVVTGGANGIGRGIVRGLLEAGATVVVADIEQDVLDTTVAALSASHPGRITGVVTNVIDDASTDALADHVYATHGRCNLLFNNAGVGSGGGGMAWAKILEESDVLAQFVLKLLEVVDASKCDFDA